MDESLLDTDILNEVLKQLSDRLELRFGIVQGQEGPERPLAEREPVGGRGEVEDDLLRLVGELEEVRIWVTRGLETSIRTARAAWVSSGSASSSERSSRAFWRRPWMGGDRRGGCAPR